MNPGADDRTDRVLQPRTSITLALALAMALAIAFTFLTPHPALGVEVTIPARGVVHAGIYQSNVDLDGVDHDVPGDNAFFDHKVLESFTVGEVGLTFAGRFHHVNETDHQTDGFNTIRPLEEAWIAKTTPVSNVAVHDTAASIARGDHDAAIRRWLGNVKTWLGYGGGRSLLIAPLQEMNGAWTPYGCDPANFVTAYRRFRDIAGDMGVDDPAKVRWVFAPNGWTDTTRCGTLRDYYPGDAWVDAIGISGYNFSGVNGSPWESPYQALNKPVTELRTFAPGKPYLALQTASPSVGGDKNQWVRDLFSYVANDPNMVGFVWFNKNKYEGSPAVWVEWSVAPAGAQGWRDAMRQPSATYQWPLTDWFRRGRLVVDGAAPPPPSASETPCSDGLECDSVGLVDPGARYHLWDEPTDGTDPSRFYFGNPGDFPLTGDWDCDGVPTPGQYRQTDGFVYLRNSNDSGVGEIKFYFGNPGDVPIVGDFNGDGCDTVSIYRPSQGQIFVINKLGENNKGLGAAEKSYFFGNPGDKPFVGDFDGDGVDTLGLHRETTGLVYFNNEHASAVADKQFVFGDPGDRLVAGDWDGDGVDTPALYRPSNGMVYIKLTNSSGAADHQFFAGPGFTSAVLAPHA